MFFQRYFDVHSVIHFIGCYCITLTLLHLRVELLFSICIGKVAGVIWEMLDEFCHRFYWKKRWKWLPFDSRGADITDLILDFSGVWVAVLVHFLA